MIQIRRSAERGRADYGWLQSRHTFSFGRYHDPDYQGFRVLRVINEDRVAPETGFPLHGHRDMEILSYVLEGQLTHKDSLGNGSTLGPGEIQAMSAGTGIEHSESNESTSELVHFLQIWIMTAQNGLTPSYSQEPLPEWVGSTDLIHAAGPQGSGALVPIHQDASLWIARMEARTKLNQPVPSNRHAWVQIARGQVLMNGTTLFQGDGVAISDERFVQFQAERSAEILWFDLP